MKKIMSSLLLLVFFCPIVFAQPKEQCPPVPFGFTLLSMRSCKSCCGGTTTTGTNLPRFSNTIQQINALPPGTELEVCPVSLQTGTRGAFPPGWLVVRTRDCDNCCGNTLGGKTISQFLPYGM